MRSFKKALTMALIFVMAIGLLTAGALDFTDANDIQYKEAVEVMTEIGAINGYTDGTFRPDGLLTRRSRKLVTYAILTERVAQYLPSGSSSFTDVLQTIGLYRTLSTGIQGHHQRPRQWHFRS